MSLRLAAGSELHAEALPLIETMERRGFGVELYRDGPAGTEDPTRQLEAGSARLALVAAEASGPLPEAVGWVAVPRRAEPRDVLVPAGGDSATLTNLAPGTRVGIAGARRWAFLRAHRSDVEAVALVNGGGPGAALASGNVDAAILGAVEARRTALGWRASELLDPKAWIPGAGQGAAVLLARRDDEEACLAAACVEHAETRAALVAEGAVLEALGLKANAPVGVLGLPHGRWIRLWAMAAAPDGSAVVRGDLTGSVDEPEAAGRALAELLLARGIGELLGGRGQ